MSAGAFPSVLMARGVELLRNAAHGNRRIGVDGWRQVDGLDAVDGHGAAIIELVGGAFENVLGGNDELRHGCGGRRCAIGDFADNAGGGFLDRGGLFLGADGGRSRKESQKCYLSLFHGKFGN